jgi:hypothetical protein
LRPSRHLASIPDYTIPHNTNHAIDFLSTYFPSYSGQSFVTTASYSKDGGASATIPGGIFDSFVNFAFSVRSTSIQDVGVYSITLTAINSANFIETSTFALRVTNTAPTLSSQQFTPISIENRKTFYLYCYHYFTDADSDPLTFSAIV